jgi:hypothetical protein
MTSAAGHFIDSLVVFYDNSGNFIAKTIVDEHDKHEMYIGVAEGLEGVRIGARLKLLIVHASGASEFGGVLKSARNGRFEVSLFSERMRRARSAVRHALDSPAVIYSIIVESKQQMLRVPVEVFITNISTTGVLLKSPHLRFPAGCLLQIEFSINDRSTIIYGKVVWENKCDDDSYNLGCKLIFLK